MFLRSRDQRSLVALFLLVAGRLAEQVPEGAHARRRIDSIYTVLMIKPCKARTMASRSRELVRVHNEHAAATFGVKKRKFDTEWFSMAVWLHGTTTALARESLFRAASACAPVPTGSISNSASFRPT